MTSSNKPVSQDSLHHHYSRVLHGVLLFARPHLLRVGNFIQHHSKRSHRVWRLLRMVEG